MSKSAIPIVNDALAIAADKHRDPQRKDKGARPAAKEPHLNQNVNVRLVKKAPFLGTKVVREVRERPTGGFKLK